MRLVSFMVKLHGGYSPELAGVNPDHVAFITQDGSDNTRLHFSAKAGDFVVVCDTLESTIDSLCGRSS